MKAGLTGVFAAPGGKLRAWTGIPLGLGVTYAATKMMPSFTAEHPELKDPWLFPIPYRMPALLLGLAMLLDARTRMAGYGVLGTTVAYYFYSAYQNVAERAAWEQSQGMTGFPSRR